MGCDIHCYIEEKREDGRWHQLGLWIKDRETGKMKEVDFFTDRCYPLFGILAGVRSCATPIDTPRGLPADLSVEVAEKYADGDEWWHDATWYDYRELISYIKGRKAGMFIVDEMTKFVEEKAEAEEEDTEAYLVLEGVQEENEEFDALKGFVAAIDDLLEKHGIYYPKFGQIRVTMWFDS